MYCEICGIKSEGPYCFRHKTKKPLKATRSLRMKNRKGVDENPREENKELVELYMRIWSKRPNYSEISGEWLGREPLSIFFHHIIPKRENKEAIFDEENVILLTFQEHQNVENNKFRYEEINNRRNYLEKKYNNL